MMAPYLPCSLLLGSRGQRGRKTQRQTQREITAMCQLLDSCFPLSPHAVSTMIWLGRHYQCNLTNEQKGRSINKVTEWLWNPIPDLSDSKVAVPLYLRRNPQHRLMDGEAGVHHLVHKLKWPGSWSTEGFLNLGDSFGEPGLPCSETKFTSLPSINMIKEYYARLSYLIRYGRMSSKYPWPFEKSTMYFIDWTSTSRLGFPADRWVIEGPRIQVHFRDSRLHLGGSSLDNVGEQLFRGNSVLPNMSKHSLVQNTELSPYL